MMILLRAPLTKLSSSTLRSDPDSELLSSGQLKSMTSGSDIMNLESIFGVEGLKSTRGKGVKDTKKKPKKKKKYSSSSSSDGEAEPVHRSGKARTSRGSGSTSHSKPDARQPIMRQQEVVHQREEEYNDGSITVDGPIFRKPLFRP